MVVKQPTGKGASAAAAAAAARSDVSTDEELAAPEDEGGDTETEDQSSQQKQRQQQQQQNGRKPPKKAGGKDGDDASSSKKGRAGAAAAAATPRRASSRRGKSGTASGADMMAPASGEDLTPAAAAKPAENEKGDRSKTQVCGGEGRRPPTDRSDRELLLRWGRSAFSAAKAKPCWRLCDSLYSVSVC